jgi:hypothetical protein
MNLFRKSVSEVFTPRSQEVNPSMYIPRPELEKSLSRALSRNTHTLICGESGNGKSWLYKKVLENNGQSYLVANCANASRLGSLTSEICNVIIGSGHLIKTKQEDEMKAKASAVIADGELATKKEYEITRDEPLLQAFKIFDKDVSGQKIIVLDNLESIFGSDKLMSELADIVILLDDPRYAICKVKFLIVGVPNGVLEYFSKTKNSESVANRIQEIEKVGSLSRPQVHELTKRGFAQLKVSTTTASLDTIADHVFNVTLGIAQRVHEYCECLAYQIEDNKWVYEDVLLGKADMQWLKEGLRYSYQVIEGHLNSRETLVARRNQVIYVIGKIKVHQFDSNDIDKLIRDEFPDTIPQTNMGVGTILSDLSSGAAPLLKRAANRNEFFVADPRYIMCIRVMLSKDSSTSRIIKKNFSR